MGKPMSGVFLCDLVEGTTDGMQQYQIINKKTGLLIIKRQAYY